MNSFRHALPAILLAFAILAEAAPARPVAVIPQVPGTVIHHQPAATGLYIGSPSLCALPDGSYLASHDLFGAATVAVKALAVIAAVTVSPAIKL